MTRLFTGLLIAVAMVMQSAGSQLTQPSFKDYPAGEKYRGSPVELKLDKPGTQMYAAEIEGEVDEAFRASNPRRGPNFAGNFVVAKWGCGAPCLRMAIVDVRTGEVYFPPLTFEGSGAQSFDLPLLTFRDSVPQNPEISFRADSDLLTIAATPSQKGRHPSYVFYFLWKQNHWTLLRREPLTSGLHSK